MYLESTNKMDSPPRARGALHLTAAGQSKIKNLFNKDLQGLSSLGGLMGLNASL